MAKIELTPKWPQQVFTHLDEDGKARSFLVETMFDFALKYPSCTDVKWCNTPIDQHLYDHVMKRHGIEKPRVDRLIEPYLSRPVIIIRWPDDVCSVVDGGHRIVKNFELGKREMRAFVFQYPFWEQFMLPEELSNEVVAAGCLTKESNIIEKEKIYG